MVELSVFKCVYLVVATRTVRLPAPTAETVCEDSTLVRIAATKTIASAVTASEAVLFLQALTSNRCTPCGPCSTGEYIKTACTVTSNTICESCNYDSSHHDRYCPEATATKPGMYLDPQNLCTPVDNKVGSCLTCSTCGLGQHQTMANSCSGGGTSDTQCSAC